MIKYYCDGCGKEIGQIINREPFFVGRVANQLIVGDTLVGGKKYGLICSKCESKIFHFIDSLKDSE